MIIVGELINSSREEIKEKILNKDKKYLQKIACEQAAQGADYIDLNAGIFSEKESDYLKWLVEIVQEVVDKPLSLDSGNSKPIIEALKICNKKPLVNSITAEKEKYSKLIPPIIKHNAKVIALCMDDDGIPDNLEKKMDIACSLINNLVTDGIALQDIYLDPLVRPVSVIPDSALHIFETITALKKWKPELNIICGLSNISFGLPDRKLINQAFLLMCLEKGLDNIIANPLDKYLMALLKAAKVLLNKDQFGIEFLKASRKGNLL